MRTLGGQFLRMHSKQVVRSLIYGRTTVVAYADGHVTVRTPHQRERRTNIASTPSVLLTMVGPDGQDLLLVGDGHGRVHVFDLNSTSMVQRLDVEAGRVRSLSPCPTEHGDAVVGSSDGTVALLDIANARIVHLARLDGPVSSLHAEDGGLTATVRGARVMLDWQGGELSRSEPEPFTRSFPRRRSTLIAGLDGSSYLAA
jgi:prepilin-type processing-associated H-X9-DG protein